MAGAQKKRLQGERQRSNRDDCSPKSSSTKTPRGSPPSAFDGNRDPGQPRSRSASVADPTGAATLSQNGASVMNKNLDLGALGASLMNGVNDVVFPSRPAQPNKSGREISVKLNTFHVTDFPSKPVYQYDVLIGSGTEKRKLVQKVWSSQAVTDATGKGWIFDGNKLAWSMKKIDQEVRVTVDMHVVDNRPAPQPGKTRKEDKFRVAIRYTKIIDFTPLRAYLNNQADFSDACLEGINFLDHLMRETPSQKFTVAKRNFFARGNNRTLLGGGVEAFKGVYASIRIAHGGFNMPARLSVNVDVANTTFWTESVVVQTAMQLCNARDYNQLVTMLNGVNSEHPAFRALNRLRKVCVYTTHTGVDREEARKKPLVIDRFILKSAKNQKINAMLPGQTTEQNLTVVDYFYRRWNKRLQFPDLPLIQMTKKIQGVSMVLPMEMCTIVDNQRYVTKLSDKQTTEMIKFAVTLPKERWSNIEEGLKMLDWGTDRFLSNYGLQISGAPTVIKGRLLPNPKVGFAGAQENPLTKGRWNLANKRFIRPFPTPLKSWGFCIVGGRAHQEDIVKNFARDFIATMQVHGCKIENQNPVIITGTGNAGTCVQQAWEAAGNQVKRRPEILFFVVPDKGADTYRRIKKSADCRYGIVSQVIQMANAQKNQAQYRSNVAMKVNAKLGGVTAQAIGAKNHFTVPTMIIGADVSHGPPKMSQVELPMPSVAAITMSYDREAIKYIAAVETNGYRVEMITKANFDDHLTRMVKAWMSKVSNGSLPKHVIYMRDGVSEGQYAQVLKQEIKDVRNVFSSIDPKNGPNVKFTVIVGSKRHHVRFFPEASSGDQNSNPLPGTLVETAVTHPREFDFYLCAHAAIKGTARPVHYQVLLNEMSMNATDLPALLYEASYQYVRSTTPVSLYPAAYYAHLAAARGNAHIDDAAQPGAGGSQNSPQSATTPPPSEVPKLLAMPNGGGINETMWYV